MGRHVAIVVYVLALVCVVVSVDILFFRTHFWPRLMVNVGIVLVFAAFGLRFRARSGGDPPHPVGPCRAELGGLSAFPEP